MCHIVFAMTCEHKAQILPTHCNSSKFCCISLLSCLQGFPSKVRDAEEGLQDSAESVQERKQQELQRSLWDLGLAWGLVLVCCTHHLGHWLHGLGWHGEFLAALLHLVHTIQWSWRFICHTFVCSCIQCTTCRA